MKKPKIVKNTVTNQDFEFALNGNQNDEKSMKDASNNRNIIKRALRKYKSLIPREDLESIGLKALWRTLQYHKEEFGKKFTTNLYGFVDWECNRELKRLNGKDGVKQKSMRVVPITDHHVKNLAQREEEVFDSDNSICIIEAINKLPCQWMKDIIRQHFYDKMSLEEIGRMNFYSKETARQKLNGSISILRQISLEQSKSIAQN